MLDDVVDLSPVVRLLLDEVASVPDYTDAMRRLKTLMPELQAQAQSDESMRLLSKPISSSTSFDVYLDGGLDLFNTTANCSHVSCRLDQAARVSRSIGLIADHFFITDHFTTKFEDFGRITNAKLHQVIVDVLVLREIQPLIEADILKFKAPIRALCKDCYGKFKTEVDRTTSALMDQWGTQATVKRKADGGFELNTGTFYVPPVVYHGPPRKRPMTDEQLIKSVVQDCRRRSNIDHLCRLNFDQGLEADFSMVGCA